MSLINKQTNIKPSPRNLKHNNFECKVCVKKYWNSLDLIKHQNDHVTQVYINYAEWHYEPFWFKLCGTFASTNDGQKTSLKDIEDTLKLKEHYDKQILSTIQNIRKTVKLNYMILTEDNNGSDLYKGFDEDGIRII